MSKVLRRARPSFRCSATFYFTISITASDCIRFIDDFLLLGESEANVAKAFHKRAHQPR
jgi:hypothetical protein